ncbi:Chromatin accessibility complex protein 1 [Portunus trituberculatus]|uniref:Chromatin accessibility complex protein 1 n=2 Tax=Portunus trituberculatus TaxID=210409 RepID=A0A5B7F3F5_PORTR|nr:Chromatin accessibility complex protein 1 [Portunus trituberculatus]
MKWSNHTQISRLETEMASPSKSPTTQSPGKSGRLSSQPSELMLPTQRVKMIMKSCPDVETVPQESLYLITKATELFIQYLTQQAHSQATDTSSLRYDDLATVVHSLDHLEFLRETIPQKITWAEAQKLMEQYDNKFEGFH